MLGIMAACGVSLASTGEPAGWAIADFDGDNRPDVAIANPARKNAYQLDLQLSANSAEQIALPALSSSPFGLHLTPRDVDGDRDLDIVVTNGILRQPVAIWINDGHGVFLQGDLASYPISSGPETFFVPPEGPQKLAHGLFVPVRRFRFGLPPVGGLLRTDGCTGILALDRSSLVIATRPADERSVRAPPALLPSLV
jgi:hypothetical protein